MRQTWQKTVTPGSVVYKYANDTFLVIFRPGNESPMATNVVLLVVVGVLVVIRFSIY